MRRKGSNSGLNTILSVGAFLLLAGVASYLVINVIRFFFDFMSRSNPEVGAAIIATSGTILVSVFSIIWSKLQEKKKDIEQKKWEIEQELRKQKLPLYEELVEFLFKVIASSRPGKSMSQQDMEKFFESYIQKSIVWSGDRFIKKFSEFRKGAVDLAANRGGNTEDEKTGAVMFAFEELLYSIRSDFGHDNKGLVKGDLLAIFLNDLDKYL